MLLKSDVEKTGYMIKKPERKEKFRTGLVKITRSLQIGIIISDAIQDKIEKVHREFARAIYEKSLHVQPFHFVESILFEPSDSSSLLQLVDIASYAIYKKFNQDDDSLYKLIRDRLFCNSSGCIDGAGLKIWP